MRKVGIMSMQRIANYGSFLQAYALKQLIEEVGSNVEFVDYHVGAPVITENADSKNKFVRAFAEVLQKVSGIPEQADGWQSNLFQLPFQRQERLGNTISAKDKDKDKDTHPSTGIKEAQRL